MTAMQELVVPKSMPSTLAIESSEVRSMASSSDNARVLTIRNYLVLRILSN
jgi:hypothetical protein